MPEISGVGNATHEQATARHKRRGEQVMCKDCSLWENCTCSIDGKYKDGFFKCDKEQERFQKLVEKNSSNKH